MPKTKKNTQEEIKEPKKKTAKKIAKSEVAQNATPNLPEMTTVEDQVAAEVAAEVEAAKPVKKTAKASARSKKYIAMRALVDKTKLYPVKDAVELVKKMSFSKFDGTVEAHLVVKDVGTQITLTFPHSTGKSIKVAIVSPEVIENIEKNIIDFDVLLAKPEDMKLLTKFARTLGPKGLMPNPKNGTLTPNPTKKKSELEAGAVTLKTEKKAPLIHTVVGKVSTTTEDLTANVEALIKALDTKLVRLHLAASMSPSVKVEFTA